MANTVTVYVPISKDIVVKAFTNAAYLQRITLSIEGVGQFVIQGTGENNTLLGVEPFTTPSEGGPDNQITVDVKVEYSSNGGSTWNAPDVYTDGCTVQAYNLIVIVAEDMVDQDYNDAVCMISWPGRNTEVAEGAPHMDRRG
jgi:Fucose-binding lectin II (PA-IIL)